MARAQETALVRFYGLPKEHKEGAPLRHIVSLKGTPTYGLAKWLFRRLKFLASNSNTKVGSLTQLSKKLNGDLGVEAIELLLREKNDETENRLGHAQIIQLLKFCLKTYFTSDGTVYEQVKGTPMGSPISGLIIPHWHCVKRTLSSSSTGGPMSRESQEDQRLERAQVVGRAKTRTTADVEASEEEEEEEEEEEGEFGSPNLLLRKWAHDS
nr:unnamed protein product [Spirometra erinaceieuropaei]